MSRLGIKAQRLAKPRVSRNFFDFVHEHSTRATCLEFYGTSPQLIVYDLGNKCVDLEDVFEIPLYMFFWG